MLHLTYSNRIEALLEGLVLSMEAERAAGRSPLEPVRIVVPNRNMQRYLELGVAQALGVAANLRFLRLESFVREWLEEQAPDVRVPDRAWLESRVLEGLLDDAWLAEPTMAPVASYLRTAGSDPDATDLRRVQLALRVGGLFEQYMFSRPRMLDAWLEGRPGQASDLLQETEAWQRALFQRCLTTTDDEAASVLPLHRALSRIPGLEPAAVSDPIGAAADGGPPLYVFGVSYVGRVFQWALAALGARQPIHVFALNPCEEFWEDAGRPSPDELEELELHPRVEREDTPALVLWGRPGREYVHLMNDLTGADFVPRFVDPLSDERRSLLAHLQHDILVRAPERSRPDPAHALDRDDSLRVLACPALRREVESVADTIWRLVREDEGRADGAPPLRFSDIAVLVAGPDRDLYLPHLASVFDEAHRIPHHVVDVPLTQSSRVLEVVLALVALPATRLARPDLLDVLTHPCVRARAPDADPDGWVALCDRLGVFHGLDHEAHRGTYIDRDLVNWDQAVRRLALGRFMSSERSGDDRAFELDAGHHYFPEETDDATAATFGLLARSLLEDVRFARDARLPVVEWAGWLSRVVAAYVNPTNEAEEADLRRCMAALATLGERPVGDRPVRHRVAAELARAALGGLSGDRGEYLADGVAVSTLVPMRAIPFRVVFVLGLGEGRFPSSERRDVLDLRRARRHLGDVSPTDRDLYAFLEALLSARDRLVLSYVARDERTGDPIAPSPVVQQLLDVVERGYLRGAHTALVQRPPLRRYDDLRDDGLPPASLPEARIEARARALGDAMRGARGPGADEGRPRAERLAELRSSLGPSYEALADLLALPRVDPARIEAAGEALEGVPRVGPAQPETLRLSLGALRRFLECPLQGWARSVVGIGETEDEAAEAQEDEPFEPAGRDAAVVLRRVFLRALREGRGAARIYAEEVAHLMAHGRWPLGPLAEERAEGDTALLEGWRRAYGALVGEMLAPAMWRFGPDVEHGDADLILPPIDLELDDPRPGATGRLRVEITGRTEPLVVPHHASLLLSLRNLGERQRKEVARTARLRQLLKSFLSHVALSAGATGAEPFGHAGHEAWLLEPEGDSVRTRRVALAPMAPDVARAWLADRVRELLGEVHAYYFPCEAVFDRVGQWSTLAPEHLARSLAYVRNPHRDYRGGSSRFGPIADATQRPAPDPEAALDMARRRFGLFLDPLDPEVLS